MNYFLFQLYKHDDPDCSELCECHMNEKLSCQVLTCIERVACNTGPLTSAIANTLFFHLFTNCTLHQVRATKSPCTRDVS